MFAKTHISKDTVIDVYPGEYMDIQTGESRLARYETEDEKKPPNQQRVNFIIQSAFSAKKFLVWKLELPVRRLL